MLPDRVEHERAGRGAVDAGEQAAVRGQPLLELLRGLGERGGRRVERRSRLERRVHDRVHGRRLLRTDRLDLDMAGHRRPTRSAAAESSWSRAALTWPCRSRMTRWPAFSHSSRVEPGDPLVQLAAVADRGELVGGAADDGGRHPAEHLDRVELVEPAEAREEVGHHLERRLRQHAVDEVDVRRRHLVAEREQVGDDARHRAADPPGPVDACGGRGPGSGRCGGSARPPSLAGSMGSRIRLGSRPPAVVEIRPTPTIRSPISSGYCSARATIVMPPIE